jgi:hypothetical protein
MIITNYHYYHYYYYHYSHYHYHHCHYHHYVVPPVVSSTLLPRSSKKSQAPRLRRQRLAIALGPSAIAKGSAQRAIWAIGGHGFRISVAIFMGKTYGKMLL